MHLASEKIPAKGKAGRPGRLLALDGLRGVAALCVAIYHKQYFFIPHYAFFGWGWTNVDLFFLISGLVLSHVYEKRIIDGLTTFPQFLSHRLARLWPVHIFAMLLMGVLQFIYLSRGQSVMDWNAPLYTFLLNLFFLQNIGIYNSSYASGHTWDGNAWSLTPEITANLIWFYLLMRRRLSSKLLVAIVLVCAIVQYNFGGSVETLIASSNLIRCTISYAVGCLLYRHFIANGLVTSIPRPWSDLLGMAVLLLFVHIALDVAVEPSPSATHWDWTLVLFVYPGLVLCALQEGSVLNTILSSRPFTFLGAVSYSVYLLHVQVALLMQQPVFSLLSLIPTPYYGFIYLALTLLLASITYRWIEVPARNALRDRLEPVLKKIFFDVG